MDNEQAQNSKEEHAELVVGPVAGLLDRLRDAVSGSGKRGR